MAAVAGVALSIRGQIERMREALLDLTRRNQLLNFRHSERSRMHVRVIDQCPASLFEGLVNGRELRFKGFERPGPEASPSPGSAPEPRWEDVAGALGVDTAFELPKRTQTATPRDDGIQVPHFADVADKKLEGIRENYRTLLEESGIPALYGAFGFLEWYEAPNDPNPQLAPLVLLPVELDRKKAGYRYQYRVKASDDEPVSNLSLQLRLKRMGVALPAIAADSDRPFDLEAHLQNVERAVAAMARWRVHRFVTIGILHFARHVMHQDLDPANWDSRCDLDKHPLLSPLLGIGAPDVRFRGGTSPADAFASHLVTDSDFSQRQAIAQALGGGSMVIMGPPGTGKSQTIANLIAAAMGAGKTVLFVAEKMAALEVVRKRLDDAGLGDHCLSLHSSKTHKKELVDDLARSFTERMSAPPPDDVSSILGKSQRIEQAFAGYENAMSTPIGALGLPLRDLIWSMEQLHASIGQLPERISEVVISEAERISGLQLEADEAALRSLEEAWWAVADSSGMTQRHPWRFVQSGTLSVAEEDTLLRAVREWCRGLEGLERALREVPGAAATISRADLAHLAWSLRRLPELGAAPAALVRHLGEPKCLSSFSRLVEDLGALQRAEAELARLTTNLDATVALAAASQATEHLEGIAAGVFGSAETLQELHQRLPEERRRVADIGRCGAIVTAELQRIRSRGEPVPASPTAIRALLLVADSLPRQRRILAYRSDATLDETLVEKFEHAAELAERLRATKAEVDGTYHGWHEKTADGLRHLAVIFRTTGLFGRMFGADYKSARTEFERLTTGRTASRQEMADKLEALAKFRLEWERWPGTAEVRSLCGTAHRGIDTDFDGLFACSRWAQSTAAALRSALGTEAPWARTLLFEAPAEQLMSLEADLESIRPSLDGWLALAPQSDISTWVARRAATLDQIESTTTALVRAGVRGTTSLSELPYLRGLAVDLASVRNRVSTNEQGIRMVGDGWQGFATGLQPLSAALSLRHEIAGIGLARSLEGYLFADPEPRLVALKRTGEHLGSFLDGEERARSTAERLGAATTRVWPSDATLGQAVEILRSAVRTPEHLREWVAFRRAWTEAERASGPRDFLRGLDWSQVPLERPSQVYKLAVYRSLCAKAQEQFPSLNRATWTGAELDRARTSHSEIDLQLLAQRRRALRYQLARMEVPAGRGAGPRSTELALIQHEAAKRKRHQSIRHLLQNAGRAIRALKPCFMMSPLSVAQYLDPGSLMFDLVVIDEASQMRPADAIGALLRTQQIVVVGDRQQLPPTTFFDRLERADGDSPEGDGVVDSGSMESILDLMLAAQAPTCDLRWHYRSRHESLIAFSNEQFYDRRLHVFPSPNPGRPDVGVHGRFVQGTYAASENPVEAKAVVDMALALMRSSPDRSLGIVAMNQKQAELIRGSMSEALRTADLGYEERWRSTLEPFFVKNLENVQGDERDVILVSLTYGPPQTGQRVAQNFGPINRMDGHRRLNVLFTRAKFQLMLFSSMAPEQVEVRADSPRGVRVLHEYLRYAFTPRRSGVQAESMDVDQRSSRQASRQVTNVEHLVEELQRHGLAVRRDLGAQNVTLPIAVLHPDRPGDYACAVECDAVSDRSEESHPASQMGHAYSRMLESFGWRRVSTWTTDWLRNPREARRELLKSVEAAVGRGLRGQVESVPVERVSPTASFELSAAQPAESPVTPAASSPTTRAPHLQPPVRSSAIAVELAAAASHPLAQRLRASGLFSIKSDDPRWDRLVVPLVTFLADRGGVAPLAAVARALGFPEHRVWGVLAEVQERLNVDQHEVLRCERKSGQVSLDMTFIDQVLPQS